MPCVRGESIVCFSNLDWGSWKQRHHHLMERFAARNRVLYVETPGMRSPSLASTADLRRIAGRIRGAWRGRGGRRMAAAEAGLSVCSPLTLPFVSAAARRHNRGVLHRHVERFLAASTTRPIVWVYLPSPLILEVIDSLEPRLLVYDCVDAMAEFRGAPDTLASAEERLLARADLVFAASRPLVEHCRVTARAVRHVPNGADVERFAVESRDAAEPADLAGVGRPRIGYVGAIREWFDWDLLDSALDHLPAAEFVLIGDRVPPRRSRSSRLHVLGPRPYASLPAYLGAFDACIIPFRDTPLVRASHPVKAYEYLAAGRPVVSTPMPELAHLGEVAMAPPGPPFLHALERAIEAGVAAPDRERRRRSVEGETWDRRFLAMDEAVSRALAERP